MFLRREKLNFLLRFRAWAWPKGGWLRAGRYVAHRLARMPGSSYSIAAGFASGAAVSFTPFLGAHLLLAILLSWLVRGNIIVALIGTVIGNPWTLPFILVWLFESGNWLLRGEGGRPPQNPDFFSTFAQITDAILSFDINSVVELATPIVWPMVVSCIPTAFVVWFAFYFPLKKMVDGYQIHRRKRRQRRQQTAIVPVANKGVVADIKLGESE